MTRDEAAAALDGDEYGSEGSPELFAQMKEAGLICLFGYSDDVIEIRGAEHDEIGAGTTLYFTSEGLLTNRCEEDDCPYFEQESRRAAKVEVKDGGDECGMFDYVTAIPHSRFKIMEEDELYSVGIVFALADAH